MAMGGCHAEAARRIPFEVELDHHRRLVPFHPSVVPWLDRHRLRRRERPAAAVGELHGDRPLNDEADVRMHAVFGLDGWLHVLRPAESHGINDPADATLTGT